MEVFPWSVKQLGRGQGDGSGVKCLPPRAGVRTGGQIPSICRSVRLLRKLTHDPSSRGWRRGSQGLQDCPGLLIQHTEVTRETHTHYTRWGVTEDLPSHSAPKD